MPMPSREDIKLVVFDMNDDDTLGFDGLRLLMFLKFSLMIDCSKLQHNSVVFILKSFAAIKIKHYQPIVLENCKFKIIIKF